MKIPTPRRKQEQGIAIFMVLSALAILTIVIADLTYSTQVNVRLAYNYVDGLKAYYMAKSGLKLSFLRLKVYKQVQNLLNSNQNASRMVDRSLVEKIWNFPMVYPLPELPNMTLTQKEDLKKFHQKSNFTGSFQAQIYSEGSKLNLNNLLVTTMPAASGSPSASPAASPGAPPSSPSPSPSPQASASPTEVDFRPALEEAFNSTLQRKKEADREFAETYRYVTGKDLVDAIMAYIKQDNARPLRPNLPNADKITPKNAPLYSLSELHLINGFDEGLYETVAPLLTVSAAPGVNVNTASKHVIWGLISEMTADEINEFMKNRDDPKEGKFFESEEKFWDAVRRTSAGPRLETIKDRLKNAGIRIITTEQSFKIQSQATVGLSTRTIEAYVALAADANPATPQGQGQNPQNSRTPPPSPAAPSNINPSANRLEGLHLIYWRSY